MGVSQVNGLDRYRRFSPFTGTIFGAYPFLGCGGRAGCRCGIERLELGRKSSPCLDDLNILLLWPRLRVRGIGYLALYAAAPPSLHARCDKIR